MRKRKFNFQIIIGSIGIRCSFFCRIIRNRLSLFLNMKDIIECIQGFATPSNTIGMGTVDPCVTDPIPSISLKRKRRRKRRMKNIKEFIKESLVTEAITVDRIKNEDWDADKLSRFLNDMKINRKDVDMFISNYPDTIKEYNFEVDDPEFEGIDELREVNKF